MSKPSEHKTVQARILEYAGLRRPVGYEGQEAILLRYGYGGQVGWTLVSRESGRDIGDSELEDWGKRNCGETPQQRPAARRDSHFATAELSFREEGRRANFHP